MATTDEDYEILPHQLLADLKSEVEALKKKLTQPDAKANELILEMESIKDSIHELNIIFQKALEQTKEEDLVKVIKIINQKLDTVVTQNETIAKGMVAISDKLEDFMANQGQMGTGLMNKSPMGTQVQHTMGAPQMPGSRMVPPLQMESSLFPESEYPSPMRIDAPPPPPPPGAGSKKKLIGAIFK